MLQISRRLTTVRHKILSLLPKSKDYRIIAASPLFDSAYYLAQNPDVAGAQMDPVRHFLDSGASEFRNPHPLFDTRYYLSQAEKDVLSQSNPLVDYLVNPKKYKKRPHLLFDVEFYLDQLKIAGEACSGNPLLHYLQKGGQTTFSPHPLFDKGYVARQLDGKAWFGQGDDALIAYLTIPEANQVAPNPLFDTGFYRAQVSEGDAQLIPLVHYITQGASQGMDPHPLFDGAWYRRKYLPDSDRSTNELIDYFLKGHQSGFEPVEPSVAGGRSESVIIVILPDSSDCLESVRKMLIALSHAPSSISRIICIGEENIYNSFQDIWERKSSRVSFWMNGADGKIQNRLKRLNSEYIIYIHGAIVIGDIFFDILEGCLPLRNESYLIPDFLVKGETIKSSTDGASLVRCEGTFNPRVVILSKHAFECVAEDYYLTENGDWWRSLLHFLAGNPFGGFLPYAAYSISPAMDLIDNCNQHIPPLPEGCEREVATSTPCSFNDETVSVICFASNTTSSLVPNLYELVRILEGRENEILVVLSKDSEVRLWHEIAGLAETDNLKVEVIETDNIVAMLNHGTKVTSSRWLVFNDLHQSPFHAGYLTKMSSHLDGTACDIAGMRQMQEEGSCRLLRHEGWQSRNLLFGYIPQERTGLDRDSSILHVTRPLLEIHGMFVKRSVLHDELGGFDTFYQSAYYDWDLCMRAATRGKRIHTLDVVNLPKREGTDIIDQSLFYDKWGDQLGSVFRNEGCLFDPIPGAENRRRVVVNG